MLRETVFLSSVFLNSEAWYSVDKQTIEELEKLDNILLKKIFELPSSTPASFLHLELGTIPIRFVLKIRRLNFLQYILKEQGDTLIHSFLVAQIEHTLKGDWREAVQHDIVELGLDLSLSEIQTMSEESFKNKVKTHASAAALVWLNSEKEKSKKVGHIQYSEIHIQNYLNSENLTVSQKKILTHLRGKMTKLRANYSKMYDSIHCQLCLLNDSYFDDTQQHLLECISLIEYGDIDNGSIYSDIFHEDPNKYEKVTLLLEHKLKLREKLIRNNSQKKPGEPS